MNRKNMFKKIFKMQGDSEASVAIKSVAAIPVEDWSIDFITPNPVCIMKDGKCVSATYQSAADSKKVGNFVTFTLSRKLIVYLSD